MDSTSIGTKYSATKNHSYDYHPSAQGDTFVSKRSTRDCAKIFEQWNPIAVIDIPFLMERMSSARMMNRFLLLHYLILSFMIASANTTSITTDQQALLSLKGHVTHDPANFLARNWNTSSPVCNWTGVTCDVRTHRVTALNISGLNLTGTIPSELGNLSSLQTLDLSFNWFSGSIPASIFNMSSLLSIRFTNNTLFGELPPNFCNHLSNLEYLFLKSNMFHGKIPSTLSNCKRLRNISLSLNDFSGTIPKEIGNVTTLIGLHLRGNKLQGEIPEELGNLAELEELWLQNNFLTGTIPSSIFNLSSLSNLDLSVNNLTGELLANICSNLPLLQTLFLDENNFDGKIPSTLLRCKHLQTLSLSINDFSGDIPKEIGNLTKLKYLHLDQNRLQGEIPEELGNLAELEKLQLQNNFLTGTIPPSIFNLSSLSDLELSFNSLTGVIPHEIDNLHNLEWMIFSFNKLVGVVPTTIFNVSTLKFLYLGSNSFFGRLPSSADVRLPNLEELSLSGNNFSGTIPSFIFNTSKLSTLELQRNSFSGFIPNTFGNLRNLKWLDLGDNYLTSSTSELSFLSSSNCKYLEYFSISNNPLGGILPRVIANQRRFTYLELFQATNGFSENNLIGRGGFGFVYKARIQDGMEVAVKVFDLQYGRAIKSFDIECGMIKRIRHRNIIKFISSCSSDDFKALVLEYMPYGSLEKCLYSSNYILDIFQRLNIMIDVASALEYLHFGYSVPIIHCDLKPNNVLLDDNMVAHLSDFGMAKPFLKEDQSLTQTQTLATIGYMAPEYGREGRVSTNGDVYSFGIMLMETFTRKKPTDESFTGEMTLKRWVNDLLLISIMEVVDANLLSHEDKHFVAKEQCMSFVFNLAMKCTIESPEERINAKEIVTKLAG
ncbi:protein kinase domain-containing protein [Citrus sinensis]|uniref:Protein kinase domain-containing protein n=1 Tax=Citrus sinensis TaxID=2711 RepID=A0ACB8JEY1_CITSI|nr:protein kinase domain-containing protein [Citrus sinensis]